MAEGQRADAVRNRAAILDAALEQFASAGLSGPVDQIAAAAGVGAGTLYRHFPTKGDLIAAVVDHRVEEIAAEARSALAEHPPGAALFVVMERLARTAATDQMFAEVIAAPDVELAEFHPAATRRFMAVLAKLLADAQAAGAVRADVDVATLKIVLSGYLTMSLQTAGAPERAAAIAAIVRSGLNPSATTPAKG